MKRKNNLKLMWGLIGIFGIILTAIFYTYAFKMKLYFFYPLGILIIILTYYISLFCKFRFQRSVFKRRGFESKIVYFSPICIYHMGERNRKVGITKNKLFGSIGIMAPVIDTPENEEEFNKLKKALKLNIKSATAGSLILCVVSCLLTYISFSHITNEVGIFFVEAILAYLILFSSVHFLFSFFEGEIILSTKVDKLDITENEKITKEDIQKMQKDKDAFEKYSISCDMFLFSSFVRSNENKDTSYLTKNISDYLSSKEDILDFYYKDICILDFIVNEYTSFSLDNINDDIKRTLDYISKHFNEFLEKNESINRNKNDFLAFGQHLIPYYLREDKEEDAKELYEKISASDKKNNNKNLNYLNKRNKLILEDGNFDELFSNDENIYYTGLEGFGKIGTDYIREEKNYVNFNRYLKDDNFTKEDYILEDKENEDALGKMATKSEHFLKDIKEKSKNKIDKKKKNKKEEEQDTSLESISTENEEESPQDDNVGISVTEEAIKDNKNDLLEEDLSENTNVNEVEDNINKDSEDILNDEEDSLDSNKEFNTDDESSLDAKDSKEDNPDLKEDSENNTEDKEELNKDAKSHEEVIKDNNQQVVDTQPKSFSSDTSKFDTVTIQAILNSTSSDVDDIVKGEDGVEKFEDSIEEEKETYNTDEASLAESEEFEFDEEAVNKEVEKNEQDNSEEEFEYDDSIEEKLENNDSKDEDSNEEDSKEEKGEQDNKE